MSPYKVVADLEKAIAEYAGSKYAVAVESGTAAIFLSIYRRWWEKGGIGDVEIPCRTYPSVPCSIIHWGGSVIFRDYKWDGTYVLDPLDITDGALRFSKGMYKGGLHCLSFHIKKHLPIGRGGMILTNDEMESLWLKKARFDGRNECDLDQDKITMLGFNFYMQPEQAARGLTLFGQLKHKKLQDLLVTDQHYPDLSKIEVYNR